MDKRTEETNSKEKKTLGTLDRIILNKSKDFEESDERTGGEYLIEKTLGTLDGRRINNLQHSDNLYEKIEETNTTERIETTLGGRRRRINSYNISYNLAEKTERTLGGRRKPHIIKENTMALDGGIKDKSIELKGKVGRRKIIKNSSSSSDGQTKKTRRRKIVYAPRNENIKNRFKRKIVATSESNDNIDFKSTKRKTSQNSDD